MGDVLQVEVDGEPLDRGSSPRGRPPKWGAPLAIALAGLLALGLLVVVVFPTLTGQRDSTEPRASGESAHASATSGVSERDMRVAAANAALAAWGEFAVTGDLGRLDGSFHPEGPQYRVLAQEATAIADAPPGPPPYAVELADAAASAEETVVEGIVSWHRSGERDQRYGWKIVLRRGESGHWLLWTVRAT